MALKMIEGFHEPAVQAPCHKSGIGVLAVATCVLVECVRSMNIGII